MKQKINFNFAKEVIVLFFVTFSMFITSVSFKSIASSIYILSVFVIYVYFKKYKEIKDKKFWIISLLIIFFLLVVSLVSNYGIIDSIKKFIFLLIVYLDICLFNVNDTITTNERKTINKFSKWFYRIVSIWFSIFILYNLFKGQYGEVFYIPGNNDKNFTAVSVLLFLCFCSKSKYNLGVLISIIIGIMLGSRLFILAIILFYVIKIILKYSDKLDFLKKIIDYVLNWRTKEIFFIIIFSSILMIAISYYMVFSVPLKSISQDRTSFNDRSNAIRVRANVYAIETICKNPNFIFYGYDDNIKEVLGVEDIKTSTKYRNFRLVQPHNFVLNLILRYGIILSIIYILIISKILSKLWNKENLPILITYIFMNMFMHSLLTRYYLIFFVYILNKKNAIEKNDKDIYICYSLYHLLTTIVKAFKSKTKPDIILAANNFDQVLTKNKRLIKKLKASKLFDEIIIFDHAKEQQIISRSKFKSIRNYLFAIKMSIKNEIDFSKYNNIYIFNDTLLLGKILNFKKIYYHVIEDGTDCFIYNINRIITKGPKAFIKKYIFNVKDMAHSKYVLDLEVNNKKGVFIKNKKIIEVSKKKLFSNLNKEEQKIIKDIFIENIDLKKLNGKTLIITQPLVASEILPNTEIQVKLYKQVIEQYCKNEKIIIKTHPRDKSNYQKEINCIIVSDIFPIEILNFFPNLKFKKIITIASTSINLLTCSKEKIILGWDYLDEFKKVNVNEK